MDVVTVGTSNEGYYDLLVESCKKNHIQLKNLGYNKEWKGFTMRFDLLNEYLLTLPDNRVVMFIDAYDVIILKDSNTILKTFYEFQKDIVFGNQTSFITEISYYQCKHTVYNGGSYIGYVKYLKQLLSIVYQPELIDKFHKDDQQIINYQCNQPKYKEFFDNHTTCDTMNKLFYITDAQIYCSFNYLIFGELNVPKNTCVLHLAGSVNGNKYLSELGYDVSKIKDINGFFKIQQLYNINPKLFLFTVIIICVIIYLFYHMIHKILQKA